MIPDSYKSVNLILQLIIFILEMNYACRNILTFFFVYDGSCLLFGFIKIKYNFGLLIKASNL